MARALPRAAWIAVVLAIPLAARAQDVTPGSKRPDLPPFQQPQEEERILPPLELPPEEGEQELALPEAKVAVREILVTGDALLPKARALEIARRYEDRELTISDIEALRDELTRAVVDAGYVTSGAVVPEQSLADGVLEMQLVAGRISELRVETDGRLADRYLRSRLDPGDAPVNARELEDRLQVLQQDARIRSVTAALEPSRTRGASVLDVKVAEAAPWWVELEGSNYESPAIGSWGGKVDLGWRNVTGFGDAIAAGFTGTEGLREGRGSYAVPLTRWDTTLEAHGQATWSEVVEAPFDELEIESRTQTYGLTLSQPVFRSSEQRAEVFVTGEWRQSRSFLLGSPFSFVEGPDEGKAEITVARFGANWSHRTKSQVLALSSLLSWGTPIFGATNNRGQVPDSEFLAWLAQAQLAHRFAALWNTQLIARGDVQLANGPLLGLEQFAMGGRFTVRGYRENALVRDNGAVVSGEIRVPLWVTPDGLVRLEAGPFVDAGWSWNQDRRTVGPRDLLSAGVGARAAITKNLHYEIYWGEDFREVDSGSDEHDLQDDGVHMALTMEFP